MILVERPSCYVSCECRVENSSSIDLLQSDRVCLPSLYLFPGGSCAILDDVSPPVYKDY